MQSAGAAMRRCMHHGAHVGEAKMPLSMRVEGTTMPRRSGVTLSKAIVESRCRCRDDPQRCRRRCRDDPGVTHAMMKA